jgi:hypothetical protein
MTTTKIDFPIAKIGRLTDLSDLAEILFPGNRSHQHAFLVIWLTLKWQADNMVPNMAEVARSNSISHRTYERVRAKMRRLGLIDRVSRFNTGYGHREGWVLSTRFERSLRHLADRIASYKDSKTVSREKDMLLLRLAEARLSVPRSRSQSETHMRFTEVVKDESL